MRRTSGPVCCMCAFAIILGVACANTPENVRDYNTAISLITEGRRDRAEEILWRLVRHYPNDHESWNQLGLLAFQVQRWQEAERCFREASRLVPGRLIYRRNLALALAEQNELISAKEILTRLIESDPGNATLRVDLARVLWLMGDQEEARNELERARYLAPEDRTIQHLSHVWSLPVESSR